MSAQVKQVKQPSIRFIIQRVNNATLKVTPSEQNGNKDTVSIGLNTNTNCMIAYVSFLKDCSEEIVDKAIDAVCKYKVFPETPGGRWSMHSLVGGSKSKSLV